MTGAEGSTPTAGDKASSAGERRRRPGGRSARVRAAVLEATLDQLAESGYDGLSFEAVAVRAGVHKTTLYRRWSDRTALVLDAMLELSSQTVPVPGLRLRSGGPVGDRPRTSPATSPPRASSASRARCWPPAMNPR